MQMPAVTRPQSTLVDPPDGNARLNEAESAVHEFRMANARPSMDKKLKFLFNSCFLPSAASCWSSCAAASRFEVGAMLP